MKKILFSVPLFALLVMAIPAHAQMMGGGMMGTNTAAVGDAPAAANTTTQDEAAGKAIWDKLQNKTVTCADLKDDDFDVLGDFFMGNMMGVNHDAMNKMMAARLGDAGEKQMHISLGKRMSGCDTSAVYPQGSENILPGMMMGGHMNGGAGANASESAREGGWQGRDGYGDRRGHEGVKAFGAIVGLSALAFFTTGSLFFWRRIRRSCTGCGEHTS